MKHLTAAFAALLCLTSVAFAATAPSLDGKTYTGEIQTQGAEKPDVDNFIFDKGTFRSTACDQYGYTAAPYALTQTASETTFTVKTHNPHGASIAWNGKVVGNAIEGTAVMTDSEGKETPMTFKGSLKE